MIFLNITKRASPNIKGQHMHPVILKIKNFYDKRQNFIFTKKWRENAKPGDICYVCKYIVFIFASTSVDYIQNI